MCFGGGTPDVTPLPTTPTATDQAVEEAAAKEKLLARRRKGRESTILTGAMGVDDSGKKTLLGQ